MKKNRLPLTLPIVLVLMFSAAFAQTGGCSEKDYKCQLDARVKALQADPKNPENYYNLGIVFQRSGAHKEAIESFSLYITVPGLTPEQLADGYNLRGISQRLLRRPDLALADFSKAIDLKNGDLRFLVNHGNALVDLRRFEQAMADYDKALEIAPYAFAYAQRGLLNGKMGRMDDAIRDFGKAIDCDPTIAESYYDRGETYSRMKEFTKAIPDYDKYIVLVGDNIDYLADGLMHRAVAYNHNGNQERALSDLTHVIELRPRWPDGYAARSGLYRELKKLDLAAADDRKVAELIAAPK